MISKLNWPGSFNSLFAGKIQFRLFSLFIFGNYSILNICWDNVLIKIVRFNNVSHKSIFNFLPGIMQTLCQSYLIITDEWILCLVFGNSFLLNFCLVYPAPGQSNLCCNYYLIKIFDCSFSFIISPLSFMWPGGGLD